MSLKKFFERRKITMNMPKVPFESPFLPDNPEVVRVQDGYNLWAEIYDVEDNVLILLEERFLLPLVAQKEYRQILDCGCGTGRMTMWLEQKFAKARITATDFSDGMLEKARKKDLQRKIDWLVADLNQPFPLPDSKFDLITSTLVIEHIEDLDNYFAQIHRVAQPGADIFVTGLHPAMHLFGISARFKHPQTKNDIMPQSQCHEISTIFNHALAARLKVNRIEEHFVDQQLIDLAPKAARYEGMPLLLIMKMERQE